MPAVIQPNTHYESIPPSSPENWFVVNTATSIVGVHKSAAHTANIAPQGAPNTTTPSESPVAVNNQYYALANPA